MHEPRRGMIADAATGTSDVFFLADDAEGREL
jgi:hypothetical protein